MLRSLSDLYRDLKQHESFSSKPYRDTKGKLTIGYGRNLDSMGITVTEGEFMLQHDVERSVLECVELVPCFHTLSPARQDVLINMCYNMGRTAFSGFNKLFAALENEDYKEAAYQMLDSKWALDVKSRAKYLAHMMLYDKRPTG